MKKLRIITMILARLLSATPQTDGEHWDLSFRYHLDAWNTDAYQQDPAPFQRGSQLSQREGLPYPWRPLQNVWAADDAMFSFMPGFQMTLSLATYPALLSVSGTVPVNTPPPAGVPPQVPALATVSSTGGYIKPGTYLIAISSNGYLGPVNPYFIKAYVPAGTNTNSVTVSNIVWPSGAAPQPMAFAGVDSLHMGSLGVLGFGSSYTAGGTDANGNPTSLIFTSMKGIVGLPDSLFSKFLIQGTSISVPGILLDTVTGVSGAHNDVITLATGGSWGVNSFGNRPLSLYYRPGASPCPAINDTIASNTASAITLAYQAFSGPFAVGDVVVIRTASSSIASNTIGDTLLNLAAGSQVGNTILILSGTGAGQSPKTIQSHTSGLGAVLTINDQWDVTPDATSIWIITSPAPSYSQYSGTVTNSDPTDSESGVASVPLTWVPAQSLYVVVSACDVNGNCFPARYQPAREIYVPAQAVASSGLNPIDTIAVIAGTATPNLSYANHYLAISADTFLAVPSNMPAGASTSWVLAVDNTDSADHSLLPDSTYSFSPALVVAAGTRAKIGWLTSQSGNTSLNFVSFNQPQTAL